MFFFCLISILIINCEKNALNTKNEAVLNNVDEFSNPYIDFGIKHNVGLSRTLNEYSKHYDPNLKIPSDENLNLFKDSFIKGVGSVYTEKVLQKSSIDIGEIFDKAYLDVTKLNLSKTSNSSDGFIFSDFIEQNNLNNTQEQILNSIENSIQIATTTTEFESIINQFNIDIINNFDTEQSEILLKQTAVLVCSNYFWKAISNYIENDSLSLSKATVFPGYPYDAPSGKEIQQNLAFLGNQLQSTNVDNIILGDAAGALGGWVSAIGWSGLTWYNY